MFFNLLSDREAIVAEMSIQVPFCVHPDPKDVLFVTHHRPELEAQAKMHAVAPKFSQSVTECKAYDIIVIDEFLSEELFKSASAALRDNGIMVARTVDSRVKDDLGFFDNAFRIVMPYHHLNFIFASNVYHPTADIILQKSDLLDGMYYYNSEIHIAEFALPTSLRESLKAQLKN